jgi:class 3 adenylate cyclase
MFRPSKGIVDRVRIGPGRVNDADAIIALGRDDVERRLARYRVGWFAISLLFVTGVNVVRIAKGLPHNWVSTACFLVALGYGLAIQRVVSRLGARRGVIYLTLVLDCFFTITNLPLQHYFAPQTAPMATGYALHVGLPSVFMVLVVNAVRMDRGAAICGAVAAWAASLWLLLPLEGLQPTHAALTLAFAFATFAGIAIASQGRRNLELMARLHLLRRFLPAAAVERVLHERAEAAVALGGELVTVTILTSDLRGFTAMSEKLPPNEVVRQLNAFHGAMLLVVDAHGGSLDKFVGDGMLVVFGLDPLGQSAPSDAGASAAVACARAMLGALEAHNRERGARGDAPLAVGIGVHTGQVIAGNIGADGRRLEFTVIGDAVNTAARLEGLTKEAGVAALISAEVAHRLGSRDGLRELPAMPVRGKSEPLRIFALTADHPPSAPPT